MEAAAMEMNPEMMLAASSSFATPAPDMMGTSDVQSVDGGVAALATVSFSVAPEMALPVSESMGGAAGIIPVGQLNDANGLSLDLGPEISTGLRRKRSRGELEQGDHDGVLAEVVAEAQQQPPPQPTSSSTNPSAMEATPEWSVSIENPTFLALVVDSIAEAVPECWMKVVDESSFKGIGFEGVDSGSVCYVVARLQCNAQIAPNCEYEKVWSFINMKFLKTFVDCIPSMNAQLHLLSIKQSNNLFVSVAQPGINANQIECEMHTITASQPRKRMANLTHAFKMEFNASTLLSIVKTAAKAGAEDLAFSIYHGESPVPGGPTQMYVEISCIGPMGRLVWLYPGSDAASQTDGSSSHPQNSVEQIDRATLKQQFSGAYSIKYLSQILKIIGKNNRSTVVLMFDFTSPMCIEYQMGDDKSYVKWLLACKLESPNSNA